MAGVERPEAPRARDRVLSEAEVRSFWLAAGAEGAKSPRRSSCSSSPASGSAKVSGMRRGELSEDIATWTVSGERTKNKQTQVVPLSAAARDLVGSCVGSGPDLVFATNSRTPSTPIKSWGKVKARLVPLATNNN